MRKQQGTILKEIRKEHHLTQTELCENLGISRTHYSKIENGIFDPTKSYLDRLLAFYNITLEDFLARAEKLSPNDLNIDKIIKICFPTEESLKYAALRYFSHVHDTIVPEYVESKNHLSSEFIHYIQNTIYDLEIDYLDCNNNSFKDFVKNNGIINSDIKAENFFVKYIILKTYRDKITIPVEKFRELQDDMNAFTQLYFERFIQKLKEA